MKLWIFAAAALALAGCATTPPPDPISFDELVALAPGGPNSPVLLSALENRPLGFALSYENLRELESRGVSPAVIDVVVAISTERRARAMAPRYAYWSDPWWHDPWYPWGPYWRFGIHWHHHH